MRKSRLRLIAGFLCALMLLNISPNLVALAAEKIVDIGRDAVVTDDGELWMWGDNQYGQIVGNSDENILEPVKVADKVNKVNRDSDRTAILFKDGSFSIIGLMKSKIYNSSTRKLIEPINVDIFDDVINVLPNGYIHKNSGEVWRAFGAYSNDPIVPYKVQDNVNLAQSYMPAQDIQILKGDIEGSPWFSGNIEDTLKTPEWTFKVSDLKTW